MNRIKALREARGLKQAELADMLNVSQATLSNWERGVHDLDNESLANLAGFFNCTIDYLLMNSDIINIEQLQNIESNMEPVYYRVVMDAKKSGIPPQDLQKALEFLKKAKERDEEIGKIFE